MRKFDNPILDATKIPTKTHKEYTLKYSSVNGLFHLITAWFENTKVGEFQWRNKPYEDGYTARYIWVVPEHQRQGLAQQMWLFAVDVAEGKIEGCSAAMPTIGPERSDEADLAAKSLNIEMPPKLNEE